MSDVDRSEGFYERLASKAALDGLVGRGIDLSGAACLRGAAIRSRPGAHQLQVVLLPAIFRLSERVRLMAPAAPRADEV